MPLDREAITRDAEPPPDERTAVPGVFIVFEGGRLVRRRIPIGPVPKVFGRNDPSDVLLDVEDASRRHAAVHLAAEGFTICDLGSKNGVFVDTKVVAGKVEKVWPRVMQIGETVMLFVLDIEAYADKPVEIVDGIVRSAATAAAYEAVRQAGRENITTLITGESGVGKEDLAGVFHRERLQARRRAGLREGTCIPVNCASFEPNRADVALFGAVKGAYTGAHSTMRGHFDAADAGTLFLDELARLDLAVQAKLLRAIETKLIEPVGGGGRSHLVDVGIVAATNADLEAAVERGAFRQDLYARLLGERITLQPLRDRPQEIPEVATLVAQSITTKPFAAATIAELMYRAWRGTNLRVLVQVVEKAARSARDDKSPSISPSHLPARSIWDEWEVSKPPETEPVVISHKERLEQRVMEAYQRLGSVAAAARELGMAKSTAYDIIMRRTPK